MRSTRASTGLEITVSMAGTTVAAACRVACTVPRLTRAVTSSRRRTDGRSQLTVMGRGKILAVAAMSNDNSTLPPPTVTVAPMAVAPAPQPIDPPPAEPSKATPTLMEAADAGINRSTHALARELSTMWTRNPEQLVRVIDDASRAAKVSPSVTLLLAIAHAETNGKILDVSEAGAVGLAQATPIACRQEQIDGKMFVTGDYTTGARAYIMKKPLGDADRIATLVLDHYGDKATLRKARRLLVAP